MVLVCAHHIVDVTCDKRGRSMKIPSIAPPVGLFNAVQRGRHHLLRLHQSLAPAPAAMTEVVVGAWLAQAVSVAADLRIADALTEGPLGLDELADRVGANPDALGRLLRALISRGIFRRRSDGRYDLTPLARTLRWDTQDSVAAFARFVGSAHEREHWSHYIYAVRTGRSVVPKLAGTERGFQPGHDESFGDSRRGGDRRLRLRRPPHHRGYCRRARPAAGRHPVGEPSRFRHPLRPAACGGGRRTAALQTRGRRARTNRRRFVLRCGSRRRRPLCTEEHHPRLARR